jgi:hypothetical protein
VLARPFRVGCSGAEDRFGEYRASSSAPDVLKTRYTVEAGII